MAAFSATDLRQPPAAARRRLGAVRRAALRLRPAARVRGRARSSTARELPQIRLENALFGTPAPTVWLQSHLWHGADHLHWWDYAGLVHLPDALLRTLIAAAALWTFAHDRFARYACDGLRARAHRVRDLRALSGGAAVDGGPAGQPRRVEPDRPDRVAARSRRALRRAFRARRALREQRRRDAVAARGLRAPLHACSSGGSCRGGSRPLLALYPIAMALALVYSGEHYVVDCLAGWVYAVVAFARRQRSLRSPGSASPSSASSPTSRWRSCRSTSATSPSTVSSGRSSAGRSTARTGRSSSTPG